MTLVCERMDGTDCDDVSWMPSISDDGRYVAFTSTASNLAVTVPLAARLPLSNDEFFTYYIARAHGLNGIRRALESGAEQTPPLSHVLSRISMEIFGTSKLAIRLPELLAYLGFSLCLYAVVSYRRPRKTTPCTASPSSTCRFSASVIWISPPRPGGVSRSVSKMLGPST